MRSINLIKIARAGITRRRAKNAGLDVTQVTRVNAQGAADQSGRSRRSHLPDLLKAAFMARRASRPISHRRLTAAMRSCASMRSFRPARARRAAQTDLPAAWKASKIGDGMRVVAEAVIKAVASGKSFADATAAQNIKIAATSQAIDRNALRDPAIAQLAGIAFAASEGDVVMAPDGHGGRIAGRAGREGVARGAGAQSARLCPGAASSRQNGQRRFPLVAMQTQRSAAAAPEDERQAVDQRSGHRQRSGPAEPVIEIEPSRVELKPRTARARRSFCGRGGSAIWKRPLRRC